MKIKINMTNFFICGREILEKIELKIQLWLLPPSFLFNIQIQTSFRYLMVSSSSSGKYTEN